MKFNEKLIELRKKEGLSQEELGYKLNVTRQTVSKWELGQTTPEMEKLVEMSKIFNISVDELVNESEVVVNQSTIIEDQPIIEEKTSKGNKAIFVIVGALIVVAILIVVKIFSGISAMNEVGKTQTGIIDRVFGIFDRVFDLAEQNMESIDEKQSEIKDEFDKRTSNLTEESYVNKETIEKMFSEFDVSSFNNGLEIYAGSKMGGTVIAVLDNIITSNKTEDRKITVKYMNTETQNEEEIKGIKRNIETFNDYEITFEYDADGFINKAIIERL